MINSRVTIFTNTDVHSLSEDINTFIKWQEAIGNIINDIKLSTCEAMVIWQMIAKSDVIDIGETKYIIISEIEDVEMTINTDDIRIVQQFIDMKRLIKTCQVFELHEYGKTEIIYERAEPTQPKLIIPKWEREGEKE